MSDQTIPRRTVAPGEIFGRLTVLSEAPKRGRHRYFLCQCSCGSLPKEVRRQELKHSTKSCGCLAKEVAAITAAKTGRLNVTHGKTHTPEYTAWQNMWTRCTNARSVDYKLYNKRTPPDEWRNFEVFLADMGAKPSELHSLERRDNDKSYNPDNCVWATSKEQSRNNSRNVNIEYKGEVKCISAWAEEFNLQPETLRQRLKAGWPIDKALNTKVGI